MKRFICTATIILARLACAGNDAGHGGDAYSQEFVWLGQQAIRILHKAPRDAFPEIDVAKLETAVATVQVNSKESLVLNGKAVDAINYPAQMTIEVSRRGWNMIANNPLSKSSLVLHEYLGILGVERDAYTVSARFREYLSHTGCQDGGTCPMPAPVCMRTKEVVTEIENAVRIPCEDIRPEDLKKIKRLRLEKMSSGYLREGDFSGLSSVEELDLRSNGFTTLPEGLFQGMISLKRLMLSFNQIRSLPEGIFADLPALASIELDRNELGSDADLQHPEALPEKIFSRTPALEYLTLEHNQIRVLPAGLFAQNRALIGLNLNDNGIESLPAHFFQGPTKLDVLRLSQNILKTIPEGMFSDLPELRVLYLESNRIHELPRRAFGGLRKLAWLELKGNPIQKVDPEAFKDLFSLQQLQLTGDVGFLDEDVFSDLVSLTVLSIEKGRVASDPKKLFSSLKNLSRFNVRLDGLERISSGFFGTQKFDFFRLNAPNLSVLDKEAFEGIHFDEVEISDTRLESVDRDLFSYPQEITKLTLGKSRIKKLPTGFFSKMSAMYSLSILDSRLTVLPPKIFEGLALRELDLSGNPFERLSNDIFSVLPKFGSLRMERCNLGNIELPDDLFAGVDVWWMSLADNDIHYFSPGILARMKVSYVYMGGNHLSERNQKDIRFALPSETKVTF